MQEQKYFIANFGTEHADKHPVNGGRYPIPSCYDAPKIICKGDIMLLCCWGGYEGCWGDAVGLGQVTHKQENEKETIVYYNYEPWVQPVKRDAINACLTEEEQRKLRVPHYKANWLFEIKSTSFQCISGKTKSIYSNSSQSQKPSYKFTVVVEQDEDGLYVASVPLLQGCYTQGETYEEALENIKDAIKLHIEARRALGEPVPIEVAIDEVQVVA